MKRRRRYQPSELERAFTMYEPNPARLPRMPKGIGAFEIEPKHGLLLGLCMAAVGFVTVSTLHGDIKGARRRKEAHARYLRERSITEPPRARSYL